ncbi:MAG TPA: DUF3306 domain-containing protein [Burkholderiales bacterium]|nr:DUF3306 domain-containing protein [Burkholderiales bacterium]
MSVDKDPREAFLSRWSRLKREAAVAPPASPAPAPATGSAPELPPLEELSLESDFRAFLHPKVEERLKRAALKKLFADPHFNTMDGLDVYIDDYNIPDPLPEGMLEKLTQYRTLVEQREATEKERAAREQGPAAAAADAGGAPPQAEASIAALPAAEAQPDATRAALRVPGEPA